MGEWLTFYAKATAAVVAVIAEAVVLFGPFALATATRNGWWLLLELVSFPLVATAMAYALKRDWI